MVQAPAKAFSATNAPRKSQPKPQGQRAGGTAQTTSPVMAAAVGATRTDDGTTGTPRTPPVGMDKTIGDSVLGVHRAQTRAEGEEAVPAGIAVEETAVLAVVLAVATTAEAMVETMATATRTATTEATAADATAAAMVVTEEEGTIGTAVPVGTATNRADDS